jgi:hypothetical protein
MKQWLRDSSSRGPRDPYAAQRVVEDEQVRGSEQTHDYGKGTLIERLPWIRPEAGSAGRTCCEAKQRPRKCMATQTAREEMLRTKASIRKPTRARGPISFSPERSNSIKRSPASSIPPLSSLPKDRQKRWICLCKRAGWGLNHLLDVENVASMD